MNKFISGKELKTTSDPLLQQIVNQKHLLNLILYYLHDGNHGVVKYEGIVYGKKFFYEVNCKEGLNHGLRRTWCNNMILVFEGNYKKGKRHGLFKECDINGHLILVQEWKNGDKHGFCRRFDEYGHLLEHEHFHKDKLMYKEVWFPNGKLKMKTLGHKTSCWNEDGSTCIPFTNKKNLI